MSLKSWWNEYNKRCTHDIQDENVAGEVIRMNNNFLFTIVSVIPFFFIDLYFGVYNLIWIKIFLIASNLLYIYFSSIKKLRFLGHYTISSFATATVFYVDNYLGKEAHSYLFYYSSLIELSLTFLHKRMAVVLMNCGFTFIFAGISIYYDHSLFLDTSIDPMYITISRWTSDITLLNAIIFGIVSSMKIRKRYEQLLEYEKEVIRQNEQKLAQEKMLLELQKQDAEYRMLKNQLNPHFVFNSLDTIRYLSKYEIDKTEVFIQHLANLLRTSLKNERSIVSVKEEVELLEDYMALQLMRFQGCIAFENTISGKALNGKLPYFSLITLAENAIKHNQCTAKNPLQIALYNDGDFIYLKNKIQKKQTSLPSTGIGLKNLRERYQLLYQVNLNVQEDEEYFVVQLKWIDGEDHSH